VAFVDSVGALSTDYRAVAADNPAENGRFQQLCRHLAARAYEQSHLVPLFSKKPMVRARAHALTFADNPVGSSRVT